MSFISKLDIFGSDVTFHYKGKEVISTWSSKLLSIGLAAASIMISLSIVTNLWMEKADLPISSGIGDGQGLKINPFMIIVLYDF